MFSIPSSQSGLGNNNYGTPKMTDIYPPQSIQYAALKKFSEESPSIYNKNVRKGEETPIMEERENENLVTEEIEKIDIRKLKKKIRSLGVKMNSLMIYPSLNEFKKNDNSNFTNYMNFWSGKKNNKLKNNIIDDCNLSYNVLEDKFTSKSFSPLNLEMQIPSITQNKDDALKDELVSRKSLECNSYVKINQFEIDDICESPIKEGSNVIKRKRNSKKVSFFEEEHKDHLKENENFISKKPPLPYLKRNKKNSSQDDILKKYILETSSGRRASSLEKKNSEEKKNNNP